MRLVFAICMLVSCIGCASIVKTKINFQSTDEIESIEVTKPIYLSLDTGYSREIEVGSTWKLVGHAVARGVNKGKVYKPVGDILTIEGTQQYEAYLVVANGKVVGFYLPASSRFSPLTKQVKFP